MAHRPKDRVNSTDKDLGKPLPVKKTTKGLRMQLIKKARIIGRKMILRPLRTMASKKRKPRPMAKAGKPDKPVSLKISRLLSLSSLLN
jgi:hypothetical protein